MRMHTKINIDTLKAIFESPRQFVSISYPFTPSFSRFIRGKFEISRPSVALPITIAWHLGVRGRGHN